MSVFLNSLSATTSIPKEILNSIMESAEDLIAYQFFLKKFDNSIEVDIGIGKLTTDEKNNIIFIPNESLSKSLSQKSEPAIIRKFEKSMVEKLLRAYKEVL